MQRLADMRRRKSAAQQIDDFPLALGEHILVDDVHPLADDARTVVEDVGEGLELSVYVTDEVLRCDPGTNPGSVKKFFYRLPS